MLTRFALRVRVLTLAVMVAVMAAGAFSLSRLPIELLPDIDFPLVTVSAFYPQAGPDQVLSDVADCLYACTAYYAPASERTVRWCDPALGIDWRVADPIVSEKDAAAPLLAEQVVLP